MTKPVDKENSVSILRFNFLIFDRDLPYPLRVAAKQMCLKYRPFKY